MKHKSLSAISQMIGDDNDNDDRDYDHNNDNDDMAILSIIEEIKVLSICWLSSK